MPGDSVTVAEGWADDPFKGAGGRRRHYALRRDRARIRQAEMLRLMVENDLAPYTVPGTQRRLAEVLGVSPSTVCRDLVAVFIRHPG